MLNNQTIEKLRKMKHKAMAQMLSELHPSDLGLSFEERLGLIVEKERMAKKTPVSSDCFKMFPYP